MAEKFSKEFLGGKEVRVVRDKGANFESAMREIERKHSETSLEGKPLNKAAKSINFAPETQISINDINDDATPPISLIDPDSSSLDDVNLIVYTKLKDDE